MCETDSHVGEQGSQKGIECTTPRTNAQLTLCRRFRPLLCDSLLPTHVHAGIIHNVERPEDSHYMGLVTSLCQDYMRRPGVVIVCTVTCTADIDTQVRLCRSRAVVLK